MIPNDYNVILQKVFKRLGKKALNTNDIDDYCRQHIGRKYRGCFAYDMMPKLGKGECCIINTDDSTQGGTHWVACVRDGKDVIMYDSFGREKNEILPKLGGKYLMTDDDAEQKNNAVDGETCGPRCIAFLKYYYKFGREKALEI